MKKYGRLMSYYDGTLPNLWTTDSDIIKSVFVKEFDRFVNRRVLYNLLLVTLLLFTQKRLFIKKISNYRILDYTFISYKCIQDFTFQSRVFRKFLTLIRDQEWKDVRSSITPAFTTGKIKKVSRCIIET